MPIVPVVQKLLGNNVFRTAFSKELFCSHRQLTCFKASLFEPAYNFVEKRRI